MRRHAKAATAGSTKRQASGLGRLIFAAVALVALVALTASIASGAVVTEHVRDFGPDGTEGSDFEEVGGVAVDQGSGAVYVLDSLAGVLHKFTAAGQPLNFTGTAPYISGNEISGLTPYTTEPNNAQIAVDSASHVVYVTEKHSVRAFQADGEAAEFTAGPGENTGEIPGFGELHGVAVDANGAIYASDNEAGAVKIYASSGESLTSFAMPAGGPTNPLVGNLALGPDGTVYVVNAGALTQGGGAHPFIPDQFPVTASTDYAEGSTLPRAGSSFFTYGVAADQVTGNIYVLEWAGSQGDAISVFDEDGALLRIFGRSGEEGELEGVPQGIAAVDGGEEFQLYVGDTETGSEGFSKVKVFGEVITPGAPGIKSTSALEVAADSATLQAEINPNTFATSYHFEYGFGDCLLTACTSVPLGGTGIGSGHRFLVVSQTISGLQPDTTYHYRVVAESSEGVTESPEDRTFTTQGRGLGFQLADRRAWEMVTPPKKLGGVLFGAYFGWIQAAEDGEGFAYFSRGATEPDPDGNRSFEPSTILARRGAQGWRSKDITAPNGHVVGTNGTQPNEYAFFDRNLSKALLEPRSSTPLSEQASERTPYLRDNAEPGTFTPLVTGKEGFANVPPGTKFGGNEDSPVSPIHFVAANSDLGHVALSSRVPLAAGAPPFASLYMWTDGELSPIGVLPAGEGGVQVEALIVGSGVGSVQHAISEDGSRVFWSRGQYQSTGNSLSALYLRDMEAGETARLDVVQSGLGDGEANPVFQAASADGTVVFFTDSHQLSEDASPSGRDLYRCEIPPGAVPSGCATLTDLSAPLPGSGESAEVLGISPAISEDGSRAYFLAEGVLDEGPNQRGESAVAGEPNLYLWQQGEGTRYVATLDEADAAAWGMAIPQAAPIATATGLNAAGSPSGRYLSFMSERSLSGYDNRDASSGKPLQEAFLYDASADRLECVSCNPTGGRPSGAFPVEFGLTDPRKVWLGTAVAAVLPQRGVVGSGIPFYQPRAVLDNGRVFFNAFGPLVPADSNGQWDVYQWEPTGTGDCSASSGGAAIARTAGGCASLISSGTAEKEAGFLDASANGQDAFFMTRARLSVTDEDTELDIYDARVDGEPARLEQSAECLGEACQPAVQAPNDPTPASAGFKGQGNLQPSVRKRCAKGKRVARRNGKKRCVARVQKQKRQSRHRSAEAKRRASR